MRGTRSRKRTTAARNRYYKWSWRWYLENQCSAYKNALTAKTAARNELTKAKKAHEDASRDVRTAWNELKKAKTPVAKAAAKKKVEEAKAERDKAYKERQAKRQEYMKAARRPNQERAKCQGSYRSSSWYIKWRQSRRGGVRRGWRYRKSQYAKRAWGSAWNIRWIKNWNKGHWGWNKYEWQ